MTATETPPAAGSPSSGGLPARADLPREATWDLEVLFATDAAWEEAFRAAEARLGEVAAFRGRLGEGAATLLAAFRTRDAVQTAVETVAVYADLRFSEDAGNPTYAAAADRATGLFARYGAAVAFYDTELLAMPSDRLAGFFAAEPDLAAYRHAVDRVLDRREHIRSAEVEELLALSTEVTGTPEMVATVLADSDLLLGAIADEHGATVALSQGNVDLYLHSHDAGVRRAAWEAAADAHLAFANTFAAALAGGVKRDVFYARARGYGSALEASLAAGRIPPAVFHTLLDTVWANLPTWHRYFRVRRRLLGVTAPRLHPADLTAPLTAGAPVVPWEEGVALVLDGIAPLGEEYVAINRRGIADRWVDALPNRGKGGGAFSWGPYGGHPYISMNWHDDLSSVSTLAHELGHSLHSYHAMRGRPAAYWPYGLFTAEVASNMHQALLGADLLARDRGRDWELAVLEERMANHLRYLFTMPILARFELDCHTRVERGEALTAEGMGETLAALYRQGYGDEVEVDEARAGITWARFSHLFNPYYVYQYATGIAGAAALAAQVRAEGAPAAERYRAFLSAGGDGYPLDLLRAAGVDLASPQPVQAAFDVLAGYVDRLEALADAA